jgi:response regulator RpfG family c-di-GMP phosphodiesterase
MAKVFLTCMEESVVKDLTRVLTIGKHRIERKHPNSRIEDFLEADIVFAGGDATQYLPLLRGVKQKRPTLPFIVVTRIPDTSKWLTALEAGADDYCSAPFETRQINWLMESTLPHVAVASMVTGYRLKDGRI